MLKFDRNSMVVKAWVTMVMTGVYKIDQVPALFGIRAAVEEVIKELQGV
ncbi:hypothetical protein HMPREF9225_1625 [Peptoniphilus duerdenii ATCC BAA-1640]|uniref:Uncharacterized protein n=1 Tax=Peptoniphilus duerdenii ATCC BAA-1640 TaxID=862517 RepID=E0NN86_9FIRM|nr:hypothetical protein [Peptoniphilus duerdenii]EFM24759.1 hypothetical protein HMPREF9225_1625 [Peptoniphilus duerdenii ATCC BAA-1640]